MDKRYLHSLFLIFIGTPLFLFVTSCSWTRSSESSNSSHNTEIIDEYDPVNAMLLLPQYPASGEEFQILATGGSNIRKAIIVINGPGGEMKAVKSRTGNELPCWRVDNFAGTTEGKYFATLIVNNKEIQKMEFAIAQRTPVVRSSVIWKTTQGWNTSFETLYSAWVNALFQESNEQTSWAALHEVTQNKDRNFLYNYLSLDEDNPDGKIKVIMEPDCADNPFFLRAYFAWKMGLPFGYHLCDRGYLGKNPKPGQWVTNATSTSKSNPVQAFNLFARRIMNEVHSGTSRTSLDNEKSDYYPLSLKRESLRPGTVFADPYGHTFILVSWIPQTDDQPGRLVAVDAQPDKTIAIKRFWKGNFLFNTSEVVGEPGFKAFRPILFDNGKQVLLSNAALNDSSGFVPFSLQQRKMQQDTFYLQMERLINPKPLDPEVALMDLIQALHEQLLVRVKSVDNGEAFMKANPGTVIHMSSNANGIFLAGGNWENYSTPNRDLRLLIAIDAVIGLPVRVLNYPEDYHISSLVSVEEIKNKLQTKLDRKLAELSISYTRSDGSEQKLTLAEIVNRRDAFEMAYNPNDGVEIRWGAPENSEERSTCHRQAPANQQKTMQNVRKWFSQRLHPPT